MTAEAALAHSWFAKEVCPLSSMCTVRATGGWGYHIDGGGGGLEAPPPPSPCTLVTLLCTSGRSQNQHSQTKGLQSPKEVLCKRTPPPPPPPPFPPCHSITCSEKVCDDVFNLLAGYHMCCTCHIPHCFHKFRFQALWEAV